MNISPPLIVAGSLAVVAGVTILVVAKNFFTRQPSESSQSDDMPAPLRPAHEYNANRSYIDETNSSRHSQYATPNGSFSGGKRKSKRKSIRKKYLKRI